MDTVIFDIDGTLANLDHRLHYVSNGKRDWDSFFKEAGNDTIYPEILALLYELLRNNKVVLCTGRPETLRGVTVKWLDDNFIDYDRMYMRPANDTRPDYIIKKELLDQIKADGYDPWLVVDDRKSVVDMWRANGLTCLQCRDWDDREFKGGVLNILVGPSGAGKTKYYQNYPIQEPVGYVSSDAIREIFHGDFKVQTNNDAIFSIYHDMISAYLKVGMTVWADATHLRKKDRMAVAALNRGHPVFYHVINRPMADKYRDGGWRNELDFNLIAKHEQTFNSQLKDILAGDNLPNVQVIDERLRMD